MSVVSYRCCFPAELDCNICYSWWKTRPENDGSKASCAAFDYCKKTRDGVLESVQSKDIIDLPDMSKQKEAKTEQMPIHQCT